MQKVIAIVAAACGSLAGQRASADVAALVQLRGAAPERLAATGRDLARVLGRIELEVVGPAETRGRLLADQEAASARQQARQLVARASQLQRHMQYEEAVAATERAEARARAGLAQLVEPALLAEVYLQRGLVLLPTDPARARQNLRLSLRLRPLEELDAGRYSPKIVIELKQVAREVTREEAERLEPAAARQAAAILRARYLVFASVVQRQLRVRIYDAREDSWRSAEPAKLGTTSEAQAALERSLRAALGRPRPAPATRPLPPAKKPEPAPSDRRRTWPWFVAGAGVVAAATGVALWIVSTRRVASAEALAGQSPLREYAAEAEGLESSARGFRTGAAVSLAIGAAALATATVGWLWRSDGRAAGAAAPPAAARLGPASLTVVFP